MRHSNDESTPRQVRLGNRLLVDRKEAGALLATQLSEYRGHHALVLGLPRGGVPVAAEVARQIHGDLDVLAARKLGAPGHEELAIGAITSDGTRYINTELTDILDVPKAYVEDVSEREQRVARRQERIFRGGLPALAIDGREVIVVDDGLATGATMRAAIWSLRRGRPKRVIVAIPVGASESCASIDAEVDELVCLHSDELFQSVGRYYRDFAQVSDEQVIALLCEHRRTPSPISSASDGPNGGVTRALRGPHG